MSATPLADGAAPDRRAALRHAPPTERVAFLRAVVATARRAAEAREEFHRFVDEAVSPMDDIYTDLLGGGDCDGPEDTLTEALGDLIAYLDVHGEPPALDVLARLDDVRLAEIERRLAEVEAAPAEVAP